MKKAAAKKAATKKTATKTTAAKRTVLKKPAAEATKETKRLAADVVDVDENQKANDEDHGPGQLRDRLKARKFDRIFEEIPEHIQELYNEAGSKKDGQARQAQTDIINSCVKRDSQGKLVTCPEHPLFTELIAKKKEKYYEQQCGGGSTCKAFIWLHSS